MDHYEGPMTGIPVTCCKVEILRRNPVQEKELENGGPGLMLSIVQREVRSELRGAVYSVTFTYLMAYMRRGWAVPMIEGRGTYTVEMPREMVLTGAHVWAKPVVRRVVNDLLHQFATEAYPLPIKFPSLPDDDPDILAACQVLSKDYARIFSGVILN